MKNVATTHRAGNTGTVAGREARVGDSALISSGGHTFLVERRIASLEDLVIEQYVVDVPQGELTITREGLKNDGPFGIEVYFRPDGAMAAEQGMEWAHALNATSRLAVELNERATRAARAGR